MNTMATQIAAKALESLAGLIRREKDVERLHKLSLLPGRTDRFAYLIETPFETYPRFAVGTTDAENEHVHIDMLCGLLESAEERFSELMGGSAQP